jgi:hypothetical protein
LQSANSCGPACARREHDPKKLPSFLDKIMR